MEPERKWFLFSRTTWINAILLAVLPLILTADDMSEVARVMNVDEIKELLINLSPAFNIGLRLISWGAVGKEKNGRPWFFSKTVTSNLLIILFAAWLGYRLFEADASIKVALVLMGVGIINIYLRVTHTERRLTVLPGLLGRII
jgi:hypothetical protein